MEGSILREGGRRVCVEPHVLILIRTEYERQAETQLVTSELALCYLREHMPSASSSATRRPPPSSQLNETGGGAGFWVGDTTQGTTFNKTNHSHLPPPPKSAPSPWFSAASCLSLCLHASLAHSADQLRRSFGFAAPGRDESNPEHR